MKHSAKPSFLIRTVCFAGAALLLQAAEASTWTGGNSNWNSNANPGWNGTGVPNAQGAVASFSSGGTTTQDIGGGVTVGTVSLTGSPGTDRSILPGGGVIFNEDGAGAGMAIISNNSARRLSFSTAGPITLADDLLILNTGSGVSTYSVSITSTIGGSGNLTLNNISNDPGVAPLTLGANNTFTGSVLIAKGATTVANNTGFGYSGNAVTLGSAGNGSATFVTTGSGVTLANNITVASGTGGALLLGSTSAAVSDSSFTGTLTLNDNVTVTSSKTGAGTVKFATITGSGALTKVGTGRVTLNTNNTYAGATTISAGTLILAAKGGITNSSGIFVASNATFDVSAVTGGFSLGPARAQTLGGFGSVVGSVTVSNNGTLSPGNSVGSLAFSNDLTLAGATLMELDKLAAAGSNDFVNVFGTLSLGGALTVTNLGAALAGGDTFNLFDAAAFANSFATLNLPSLAGGLTWDTTLLNTQGILAIAAIPEPATWALALAGLGLGVALARRRNGIGT